MGKKLSSIQILGIIGTIVGILVGLHTLGLLNIQWPSSSVNSVSNCNITAAKSYYLTFYKQPEVFCVQPGQYVQENFTFNNYGGYGTACMYINGTFISSGNIGLYIFDSVQYGEFLRSKNPITDYKWHSGNVQAANVNATKMPAPDTYYVVFYNNGTSTDTVTIQSTIQGATTYC